MTPQQFADPGRDDVIAPGAVVKHAELILYLSGPVDRDRDADAILREKLDDFRPQESAVGRKTEIDFFAHLRGAPARVGNGRFEHREIQESLAAKESEVRDFVRARFPQHELHALPGRFLAHERGLLAVPSVHDPVFSVLVTIGATKVALVGDVEDESGQREGDRRQIPEQRLRAVHRFADGPCAQQFRDSFLQFRAPEAVR